MIWYIEIVNSRLPGLWTLTLDGRRVWGRVSPGRPSRTEIRVEHAGRRKVEG
jgi:hypothetical protein